MSYKETIERGHLKSNLSCGNTLFFAKLKKGETVLDLGCGMGLDCLLASDKVGLKGNVIGIDSTPRMIKEAKKRLVNDKYNNVSFRKGEIENLYLEDDSIDVAISNCVINLSLSKKKILSEIFRVLKPKGRFVISDIMLLRDIPGYIKKLSDTYLGCISGAMLKDDFIQLAISTGFKGVKIVDEKPHFVDLLKNNPIARSIIKENIKRINMPLTKLKELGNSIVSVTLVGNKI